MTKRNRALIAVFLALIAPDGSRALASETRPPALSSALTSADELHAQIESLDLALPQVFRSSAICSAYGACEEVTYYEDYGHLHMTLGSGSISALKGYPDTVDEFSQRQLELHSVLLNGALSKDIQYNCHHLLSLPGVPQCTHKTYEKNLELFSKKNYLDPVSAQTSEENQLKERFSSLMAGNISKSDFVSLVLNSPMNSIFCLPFSLRRTLPARRTSSKRSKSSFRKPYC